MLPCDPVDATTLLRPSAHVSWFHRREAVFAYHDLWGFLLEMSADLRDFVLSFEGDVWVADAAMGAPFTTAQAVDFADVLARHGLLVAPEADERAALLDAVPVKAPWRVAEELGEDGIAVVRGRSPGSERAVEQLTGEAAALWRAIDGRRTIRALAADVAPGDPAGPGRLAGLLANWTHSHRQWVRMSPLPEAMLAGRRPPYLDSTMPYARLGEAAPADPFSEDGALIDNAAYHSGTIADAEAQFEDVETTLSHLFRDPHPALQGRTWGAAFRDALVRDALWPEAPGAQGGSLQVIEVGGGLGWFARRLLEATPDREALRYTICDIAPALQAAQRARLAALPCARCETVDAEALPLAASSVDLAISNEVIADLRTAWLSRDAWLEARRTGEVPQGSTETPALDAALRWGLDLRDAPERFALNIGAMDFVARLGEVLRPGGAAVLTEFGHRMRNPVESTHLDHPEFSIHFGHLAHVARRVGLRAEIVDVPAWIGLDGDHEALRATRTWWMNLRHLAAVRGVPLTKRAWTRPMLRERLGGLLDRLEGLRWQPLGERTMGLVPGEFLALILRRPES